MPANFKTYEAQSRLVAALVAANPGMKLDFKGEKYSELQSVFCSSRSSVGAPNAWGRVSV